MKYVFKLLGIAVLRNGDCILITKNFRKACIQVSVFKASG